ncbi:MAG: response regulator [Chitinophagaceae bacterium]
MRLNDMLLLQVEVTDTGIGISENDLYKLFTSFSQVDNSTTKSFGGTGLGLAISKKLCELMGGTIGVYSTFGLGSTFWFSFETNAAKESDLSKRSDDDLFTSVNFPVKNPKILLVDDNQVNRQVSGAILKKAGCIVDNAVDGFEAVEKVKNNFYHLILMDIQMPQMDGVTATRLIKAMNLPKPPPIIAMTAYSMQEDKAKYLNSGLDDYIAKPIKGNLLLQKVQSWLKIEDNEGNNDILKKDFSNDITINQENILTIDVDIINQLKKFGGAEMVKDILDDFEAETLLYIQSFSFLLKKKNYTEILSKLHTLKGNAGTLGINKVAAIAANIETKLKNKDLGSLKTELNTLYEAFDEFQKLNLTTKF